jgi:hypothetical protein
VDTATISDDIVDETIDEMTADELTAATPADETEPKRGRATRKPSTARKTRTVELTLTVTGTADGEWQAELTHGGKRVVQGLAVSAAAVSDAAKQLHPDIFAGINTVITAARDQHRARMAELEAELNRVKQALAELDG